MMEIEKEDVDEGTVVQEIQPGYIMHDRLLRPAMVGVSKKSSTEILKNIPNNLLIGNLADNLINYMNKFPQ